jgi:uncharacterized membrane protein (DUF4010 family)
MDVEDLLSRLALALGIGLLIGLERAWRQRTATAGQRAAGIRTFALSGLLGGVFGAIADGLGEGAGGVALGLGFATYAAVIAVFSRDENRADGAVSATTAVAAMLTFALGAYALVGHATAAAAAVLLAIREQLHGWVEALTWEELRSGLVLLTMSFVALPIVPNESMGPYGGVNPREVWLIAIVLAGVSFLGYAAVRYFGSSRGILLAAAAGGLVSSTAVTVTNARRAAAGEGSPRLLAAGASLATAISFLRVLAIVVVLKPEMVARAGPALLAGALAAGGCALAWSYRPRHDGADGQAARFRNPFGLRSVVGFALFLALILVLGRAAIEIFGAAGAVIGAAIVGLADVDAVSVSIVRLVPGQLDQGGATLAILVAVASNTLSKLAMGAAIGRGQFAMLLATMSLGCLLVTGAAFWAADRIAG